MSPTIKVTLAVFVLAGSIVTIAPTTAQNYPTKPIRMIVPFASGSATDTSARLYAVVLSKQMGQSCS